MSRNVLKSSKAAGLVLWLLEEKHLLDAKSPWIQTSEEASGWKLEHLQEPGTISPVTSGQVSIE